MVWMKYSEVFLLRGRVEMSQSIQFKVRADSEPSSDLIALEQLGTWLLDAIDRGDDEAALLIAVSLRQALQLSIREYLPFPRNALDALQRRVAHDRASAELARAPVRLRGLTSARRFLARFRDLAR